MRYFITLILLFFSILVPAQELSNSAEISVLTIGPGQSLNDAFGHSAFRIEDKEKGVDIVFNYGVYDFEAPNFILKFAQGKLNYLIGANRFNDFFNAYSRQNRSIDQQILNLSLEEKQKLFDYLINNYKPENRRYVYDFFFDNCATKIKDVVEISTNNTLTFNTPSDYEESTFRTLIQNNLNKNSWGSLGIDLALGAVIDQTATPEQHMFLPKNIYAFFSKAMLNNNEPLVKSSKVFYKAKPQSTDNSFFISPLFILGILATLIIFITYNDFKTQKRTKLIDFLIFIVTGLAGIVILLLWFATDHEGTHNNYNLLWANPLNLIVLFQILKTKAASWFKKYLKFLIILVGLLTFHWVTGVQVFAIGLIPLLIALLIRYIFLIKYYST
ncbi:MAG: DUF4105 domain-containing protein [Jejuia sp.]